MFEKILEVLEKYLPRKDVKGLSEDGAVAKLEEILSNWKASVDSAMEENEKIGKNLEMTSAKLEDVEKECDTLKVEIEAYRVKEENEKKLQEKMESVEKAIEEVGLDPSTVSEELYNILLKLEEEDAKTMLQKFSEKVSTITDSGKDRPHESKDGKEKEGEHKEEKISVEEFTKRYMKKAFIVEE
jgi:chromosome segregation ATPase